ncbi:MAG TPA: CBS domain-containing protein, partial [Rhodocyclaceae bacterium]|nr:CBS domain-containing protein [Rhodocyclaceae bacterium]
MSKRVIRDVIEGRPLITAKKDMTVRAACQEMAARKIGALLVVDRRKIQGIFTERDALVKVLAAGLDPETTLLSQVMVAEPLTIRDARPLSHALHMMADGGFRHVPVVDDDGHPVGMVSA